LKIGKKKRHLTKEKENRVRGRKRLLSRKKKARRDTRTCSPKRLWIRHLYHILRDEDLSRGDRGRNAERSIKKLKENKWIIVL